MSLMFACERSQILLMATGVQEAKSDKINMVLNTLILTGPCILAIVYPNVGQLAGTMGAFGGFFCIFFLPTVTYLSQKRLEILNPALINALRTNEYIVTPPSERRRFGSNENSPKPGEENEEMIVVENTQSQILLFEEGRKSYKQSSIIPIRESSMESERDERVFQMKSAADRKKEYYLTVVIGVIIFAYGFYVLAL